MVSVRYKANSQYGSDSMYKVGPRLLLVVTVAPEVTMDAANMPRRRVAMVEAKAQLLGKKVSAAL